MAGILLRRSLSFADTPFWPDTQRPCGVDWASWVGRVEPMKGRFIRRFPLASLLILVAALATNGTTAASVIGQTGSDPNTGCLGVNTYDLVQPTVTTGASYNAPITGVITSWSHRARDESAQQVTMKIWRLVSGNTYRAVGHDGPRLVNAGVLNTFEVFSVPVHAGDVLGLNVSAGAPTACFFPASGDSVLQSATNTADGQEATYFSSMGYRANISATVEPDADQDGFGDETQDQCPSDATTHRPCPILVCPTAIATTQGACPGPPLQLEPPRRLPTCKGTSATIVGTPGNDVRRGTRRKDVIVGLGGNDELSGLAGNDLICGGAGRDLLRGGSGMDTLLGHNGKDTLKGGGGDDVCKGGKSADTASECEVEKSI